MKQITLRKLLETNDTIFQIDDEANVVRSEEALATEDESVAIFDEVVGASNQKEKMDRVARVT